MLTAIQDRLEAEGASGDVRLHAGEGDQAVITFLWSTPSETNEANLVVTMEAGRIAAMKDYRRERSAYRAVGH